ncbi:MAG: hypothetical protein WD627_04645 [Actinomycetota bacterium]
MARTADTGERSPRALRGKIRLIAALAIAAVAIGAPAAQAFQRDQIDAGFQLDQLIALGGAGADPGPQNPRARLDWAVATAIPQQWRQLVVVVWSVGEVTSGHLALTFYDGTTVVSPRLLRRSSQEVLATVAHEMGHQIVITLLPAQDGTPPRGFMELFPRDADKLLDEGWADCVSRVWTGSLIHTSSESAPCSVDAARYVASLLADPQNLIRENLPLPGPVPSPVVEPSPSPEPSPFPSAEPEPESPQIAQPRPDAESEHNPMLPIVIGAILLVAGPFALVALVKALVPDEEGT